MLEAAWIGLTLVVQWPALGYLFGGVLIGLYFGVVPGLSGLVGMAILLPFTFEMNSISAFAFLLGMFAVTTTSDTIASVLLGIPGTAASQATILDGHPMAKQGEASRAFGAAFTVSALGGVIGAIFLGFSIPIVRPLILSFASPEFFLLGVLGYLGTQILAMATVLRDVLNNVSFIPEVSILTCMVIACAVLVFYCVTGGIVASVYTDLVQGAIMIVAAVFVFFAALSAVDGGLTSLVTTLVEDDPEAISPWGTLGMMGSLSWFVVFVLGSAGQPHVITKFMMNRRVEDARRTLPVSAGGYMLCSLLWLGIGLAMRALVIQGGHPELASPDEAAPQFLQFHASPMLAGVVFAGLFAAIMSTADSFLNLGAAAVVHDIPRALYGRSLSHELFWARVATVVLAVGSAIFVLYSRQDLVALLGAFGWGTFAAALVPTVAIGFNWKRATATAANVAIVTSLIVNFGIEVFDLAIPYGITGGFVALLLSTTLFFGISLGSPPPTIDPDIEAVMDL